MSGHRRLAPRLGVPAGSRGSSAAKTPGFERKKSLTPKRGASRAGFLCIASIEESLFEFNFCAMEHFNQLFASIRCQIEVPFAWHPCQGAADRRSLSGGLRYARPPAISWQPFRLPVHVPFGVGGAAAGVVTAPPVATS